MARRSRLSYEGALSIFDSRSRASIKVLENLVSGGLSLGALAFPAALGSLDAKRETFRLGLPAK
ncbi:NACHT N-terminal helical domain 7-containing protein [Catelliglobosispora koreensis]|uniref:NACHT N-terminal helical domain 7-containing protein n=1 Tax=Catelliglobosispora koreensis TaxID=129052 RepID=UPI003898FB2C